MAQSTISTKQLEYLKKREHEFAKIKLEEDAQIKEVLVKQYQETLSNILDTVNSWIGKYASQNGMTFEEARKAISSIDMKGFQKKAKKYVEDKDKSEQANEEMRIYNLNMRISRQELLAQEIRLQLKDLGIKENEILGSHLNLVGRAELERRAGILGLNLRDKADIERILPKIINGSHLGAPFSDRIWQNKRELARKITDGFERSLLRGERPDVWAKNLRGFIKDTVNGSIKAAERLAYTEASIVQEEINTEAQVKAGYDSQVIITELGACEICKPHDGKIVKIKDRRMGDNVPCWHPNCRCTAASYYDDDKFERMLEEYEKTHPKTTKKDIKYSLANEKLADKLQVESDKWFNGLTHTEKNTLVDYTDTDFIRINKYLKNQSLDDYIDNNNTIEDVKLSISKKVETLDNALSKFKLDNDVVFYRGVSLDEVEFYKNSNIIKDFKSLTTDRNVIANDFAEESEGVIVHFKVKKGTNGAYVGLHSYNSGEREFILGRNQKFTTQVVNDVLEVIIE